ncbi:MFS transporter [Micromonospora matsumotoense]|uniref:MDR family MFS transporter n=1 Tax=Micromonospora matsumotoense TaxID=121616 RepID=UPI003421E144
MGPRTAMPDHDTSMLRRLAGLPRPVWVICGGVFLNKLGNFLSVFLLLYLTHEGYSPFQAGVALGAIGLGSFFGNAVGGTVADRIGRRPAIVVSMIGAASFTLAVPLSPNIWTTVVLCVVIGFFARLFNPAAGAILVDSVQPEQLLTAFGMYRLAINAGMAIGAACGGILAGLDYNYLFVGNAVASALFGLLVFLLLPETRPRTDATGSDQADRPGSYRDVFSDRALVLYVLAIVAGTYVYVQSTSTLSLHVRDAHLGSAFYGVLLAVNAAICVLVELPMLKLTADRHPGRVLAVGMVLQSVGIGLTAFAFDHVSLLLTVVLWSLAETIYSPVAQAIPGMLSPEHLRGRYQGAEGIAATIGQTVGPALGGYLYAANDQVHWLVNGLLGFLAAAIILIAGDPRHRRLKAFRIETVADVQSQGNSALTKAGP